MKSDIKSTGGQLADLSNKHILFQVSLNQVCALIEWNAKDGIVNRKLKLDVEKKTFYHSKNRHFTLVFIAINLSSDICYPYNN